MSTLHFRSHQNEHQGKKYFLLSINTTRRGAMYYVYKARGTRLLMISIKEEFEDPTKTHYTHLSLWFYDLESICVKHADTKSLKFNLGYGIIRQ